jgi:DnaJ-class molecular chaperone
MSTARRAYNLLRAYINREWDRLESVFRADAERELEESLTTTTAPASPQTSDHSERADEETSGEERRLEEAYRVLGLSRDASLTDLKRAYKRLSERSRPANFPEGSEERKRAARIHLKVQEAYDTLLPLLDARLRRFKSLDLD